jgi:hypothetical protein
VLVTLFLTAALSSTPNGPNDRVCGGEHWRLATLHGPVHVWQPGRYDRRSGGTVVYVHGFSTDADGAWGAQGLPRQFEASQRNATFLVPEAPSSAEDGVSFPSLFELFRAVRTRLGPALPRGPLVVVGHSAAHLTVLRWLRDPRLEEMILLDALYGEDVVEALRSWLKSGRGRLVLVSADTAGDAEELLRGLPSAVRGSWVPESAWGFTPAQRRARVLSLHSQYGHLDMVTSGKVIPQLLSLTRLPPLPAARPQAGTRGATGR